MHGMIYRRHRRRFYQKQQHKAGSENNKRVEDVAMA